MIDLVFGYRNKGLSPSIFGNGEVNVIESALTDATAIDVESEPVKGNVYF